VAYRYPHYLHSSPTRRSSDLQRLVIAAPVLDLIREESWVLVIRIHHRDGLRSIEPDVRERRVVESWRAHHCHAFANHGHRLAARSEEHTSELQSRENLVCRLL